MAAGVKATTIKPDTALTQILVQPEEKLQQALCPLPVVMALVHQQIQKHHWKALLFGAKQLLAGYSNTHDRTRNNPTGNMPSLNYSKFRLTRESNQTSWERNITKCTWLSNGHMKIRVQGYFYTQMYPSKVSMPIYKVPSDKARGRQYKQQLNDFLG